MTKADLINLIADKAQITRVKAETVVNRVPTLWLKRLFETIALKFADLALL